MQDPAYIAFHTARAGYRRRLYPSAVRRSLHIHSLQDRWRIYISGQGSGLAIQLAEIGQYTRLERAIG